MYGFVYLFTIVHIQSADVRIVLAFKILCKESFEVKLCEIPV